MGEKKVRRPEYPGLNLNEGQLKGVGKRAKAVLVFVPCVM